MMSVPRSRSAMSLDLGDSEKLMYTQDRTAFGDYRDRAVVLTFSRLELLMIHEAHASLRTDFPGFLRTAILEAARDAIHQQDADSTRFTSTEGSSDAGERGDENGSDRLEGFYSPAWEG